MAYIFEILADHLDPRFPSFSLLGSNRSWHPNSLWQLWTQHFFCHLCDIFPMSAWFCKILTSFECAFYLQIFAQERMANLTSMDVVSVDDDGKVVPSDAETVATTFPETDGSSDEDDGTLAIHCIIFLLSLLYVLWILKVCFCNLLHIRFSTFSGDVVLRASSDFDSFAKLCLPVCHVDQLPPALRMDRPFRIRYGKFAVLVRRGFTARLVHKHFQELDLWPLGMLLTAEGPQKRQRVNWMHH